jgi:amino acid transporter
VVGNVGLLGAVAVVLIAHAVTVATAASVSAVSTNMRVGQGGAYYIISRSLGVEIGAAIGIPLFLAQAFSVTLYAFGLAESLQLLWPSAPQRPVAAITVVAVSLLAATGSGLALRLQLPIMGAIVLSLVVLGIGVAHNVQDSVQLGAADGEAFWAVFAVFFPAVTGILAGISLSGDLARPERSIPWGTMGAVGAGFLVYLGVVVALGIAASPQQLVEDTLIWFTLAGGISFLIYPALWGAIFSSAVGSILGAPRTLQAMADDRVLPRAVGWRIPGVKGPGMPLLVSTAVALGAVALGDLNAVAPMLTMFFLTTYGMINLVAGIERLTGDPSYRPTLQIPWWVSLAGAFGCFVVMFLINPLALMAALVVEVGVYLLMRRRALTAPWGDLRRGALMALVRSTALQLKRLPRDPRNWRPNILLFAGDVTRRRSLVRFGAWLALDRGILTVSDLRVAPLGEVGASVNELEAQMNRDLDSIGIAAFGEIEVVEDFVQGALATAQANGIAGIESNTVMFGWSDKPERQRQTLEIIEQLASLGISAVICKPRPIDGIGHRRLRIDVWWGGLMNNGDMLVLLAHLLSLNPEWRDAAISIKSIATSEMMLERNRLLLDRVVRSARIRAMTEVKPKPEGTAILDLIRRGSEDADVVLLGLRSVSAAQAAGYARRLTEMIETLPSVLFVRSAGEFRGRLLGGEAEAAGGVAEGVGRESP